MKVKKQHLELLFLVIKGTDGQLNLAESRKRDAILKSLIPSLETFYSDRKVIFEKFCDKDEEGNPNVVDSKYTFHNSVVSDLTKEMEIFANEEVVVDDIGKELLDKSTYMPKLGEAEVIDSFI